MYSSTEKEILGYLDDKNIELVVPEDKEHDYFHNKRI
jgi:hypothetical protein